MKVNLIESLGNRGIITQEKSVINGPVEFVIGCDGVLVLIVITQYGSAMKKAFNTVGGKAIVNDFDIMQGPSRVEFTRSDGVTFNCGELHRNGRFLKAKSNADDIIVSLAIGYIEQEKRIEELKKEMSDIKTRYGISII